MIKKIYKIYKKRPMTLDKIELDLKKINIIVAYTDLNRFMAFEKDLPWKRALKGDMRFVNLLIRSKHNIALIVGRITFETLPKYKNINILVVTSQDIEGVLTFRSFNEALEYCDENSYIKVAFGGARIYEESVKHPFVLYATVVEQGSLCGDVIAPDFGVKMENISKKVEKYLLDNNIFKSWSFDGTCFTENGYKYSFYFGKS